MDRPLSLDELQSIVPNAIIMKYGELQRFSRLPRLPLILLYETKPDFGHWVCILETPEGIEHFDSYGVLPDNELKWVPNWLAEKTGQNVKRLLKMLFDESELSGKKINYNAYHFQGKDTSVCGRWCAFRIFLGYLTNEQFHNVVMNACKKFRLSPDKLVATIIALPDEAERDTLLRSQSSLSNPIIRF
jgi:hypothetical protein